MVAIGRVSSMLLSAGIVLSSTSTATGRPSTEKGGPGSSPPPASARDEPTPSPTIAPTTYIMAPTILSAFELPRTAAPAQASGQATTSDTTPAPTTPPKFFGITPAPVDMSEMTAPGADMGDSMFMYDLPRTAAPTTPSYTGAPTSAPTASAEAFGAPSSPSRRRITSTFAPTYDGSSWMSGFDEDQSGSPTASPTSAGYMEPATSSPTAISGDEMVVRKLLKLMFGSNDLMTASSAAAAEGSSWMSGFDEDQSGSPTASPTSAGYMEPATSSPTAISGDEMVVRKLLKSMFGSNDLMTASSAAAAEEYKESESDEAKGDISSRTEAVSSSASSLFSATKMDAGYDGYDRPQEGGNGRLARSYYSKVRRALRGGA